jgi:hypothetical protein
MNGLRKDIGFTMLIDPVVEDIGLTGAAVFGSVYRYSQMRNEVCFASQTKIGNRVGLSRSTTLRWIDKLLESNYLRIGARNYVLPNGNVTNLYFPTKKCGLEVEAFEEEEAILLPADMKSFLNYSG